MLTELKLDDLFHQFDPLLPNLESTIFPEGCFELPYYMLGGPGFERAIYELLLSMKRQPRFFGKSGDAQYGIDIITGESSGVVVYQCKNLKECPRLSEVKRAVELFKAEWLSRKLPVPEEFVYICPHKFDSEEFKDPWEEYCADFKKSTGVRLQLWNRTLIDTQFRLLPDVVSGLFSPSHAEQFCGKGEWRERTWIRITYQEERFPDLTKFFELRLNERVYGSNDEVNRIRGVLGTHPSVVIRGLPGSGKTFLALLAASSRRHDSRRVYYATCKDGFKGQVLWEAAERRVSIPCVFILDDCQFDPETARIVFERLGPILKQRNARLLMIFQGYGYDCADEEEDDSPLWLHNLKKDGRIVDISIDISKTREITRALRPEWPKQSFTRFRHLYHVTGGDLVLLGRLLPELESPEEIDEIDRTVAAKAIIFRYFNRVKIPAGKAKLASIAQFNLAPEVDFFEATEEKSEIDAPSPLIARVFAPDRIFQNPTLAALTLRAFAQLSSEPKRVDATMAVQTASALKNYIKYLAKKDFPQGKGPLQILRRCISFRLHLMDPTVQREMYASIVGDKDILELMTNERSDVDLGVLGACLKSAVNGRHDSIIKMYVTLLEQRLLDVVDSQLEARMGDLSSLGSTIHALRRNSSIRVQEISTDARLERLLNLIVHNGTWIDLFNVLRHSDSNLRKKILLRFDRDNEHWNGLLLERSIVLGRSVRTIDFTFRDLKKAGDGTLEDLESAIGAANLLKLLSNNGTIVELFNVARHLSSPFREEVFLKIQSSDADALVERAISDRLNIGTIDLLLRDLAKKNSEQLRNIVLSIGIKRIFRLLSKLGNIVELVSVCRHLPPELCVDLLIRFGPEEIGLLIERTISMGQSIEQLHFHLSAQSLEDGGNRNRLLEQIGTKGFRDLLVGVGTLSSLSKLTNSMNKEFRDRFRWEFERIRENEWRVIIGSGWFLNACNFIERELRNYSIEARNAFEVAVQLSAKSLVRRAKWRDLNESVSETKLGNGLLRDALSVRLSDVSISVFPTLDLVESANAIACCWRMRPDLKRSLAIGICQFIPPPTEWPLDRGQIGVLRLIFELAHDPIVPEASVRSLLSEVCERLSSGACSNIHTQPLFWLLWRMISVCRERFPEMDVGVVLSPAAVAAVVTDLDRRVDDEQTIKDEIYFAAILGLIAAYFQGMTDSVAVLSERMQIPPKQIQSTAGQQDFVVAGYFFLWLSSARRQSRIFQGRCVQDLLESSDFSLGIGVASKELKERLELL